MGDNAISLLKSVVKPENQNISSLFACTMNIHQENVIFVSI